MKKPKPHEVPWCWAGAAIRTLDASYWTLFLARWFGRRSTNDDSTLVGHEWRGKFYLTDYVKTDDAYQQTTQATEK